MATEIETVVKKIIGTLQESSLHHDLKTHFTSPEDEIEVSLNGYVVDVLKDHEVVEIQTTSFGSIKSKLWKLVEDHKVRLVYPIAEKKYLLKLDRKGKKVERRKSPKKGRVFDVFNELVSLPQILNNKNFTLHIVMIHEEEVRIDDGKGSWRRKGWSIKDHRLLEITREFIIDSPNDLMSLFPGSFPQKFTNKDLKELFKLPKRTIQKTTYTLRHMGQIKLIGKLGRYNHYALID